MEFNTEIEVDLEEVRDFIESEEFTEFLLNNNTDIAVPGFILTVLFNKLEELEELGE